MLFNKKSDFSYFTSQKSGIIISSPVALLFRKTPSGGLFHCKNRICTCSNGKKIIIKITKFNNEAIGFYSSILASSGVGNTGRKEWRGY